MATVYDKSSLFLAPSGVSNGTVFVQKPVPIYGSEQVTNGDFSTDSDWTKGTGWSIANGKATFENSGGADDLTQTCLESGKTYLLTFDTLEVNGGNFAYAIGGSYTFINNIEANKTHRVIAAAGSTVLKLRGTSSFNGSIDNVSIKEVLVDGADFDFTRGSNLSATRVNEAQLIEKGRENLLLQSNQLDTTWTTNSASITGGQAGYDGSNNAWKSTNINPYGRIIQNVTSSGVNTFSIYAKAGNSPYFRIQFQSVGSDAFFDLSDGSVIKTEATIINAGTESVGNGWYRVFASVNEAITDVRVVHTGAGGIGGGSIGGYFYIQDAQLEQGLVATSLITTGASTVQAGLLENTPRLDYSGGATCPSLLLEPSRSNLVTQSEYTGGYNGINTTQEFNALVSPEGVQNAVKIETTSTGQCHLRTGFTAATGNYVGSVFIKKQDFNYIYMELGGTYAWFNINDGTKGNSGFYGSDWTYVDHSIEDYGNGWYRCALVGNCLTAGGYNFRSIQPVSGNGSYNSNLSGGLTYFYGAQVEQGSYATSYIPTYGTSQTRADEVCKNGGSAESINSVEGVAFVECSFLADDVGENRDFYISDGTATNRIRIRFSSSDVVNFLVYNGSVQADINYTLPNPTNNNKIAVKWKANDFALWVNGTERGTDTSGTTFSTNTLDDVSFFTTYNQSQILHSNVKQVAVFKEALSDLDLAILTGATTYETFGEMALALNYTVYE